MDYTDDDIPWWGEFISIVIEVLKNKNIQMEDWPFVWHFMKLLRAYNRNKPDFTLIEFVLEEEANKQLYSDLSTDHIDNMFSDLDSILSKNEEYTKWIRQFLQSIIISLIRLNLGIKKDFPFQKYTWKLTRERCCSPECPIGNASATEFAKYYEECRVCAFSDLKSNLKYIMFN